MPDWPYLVANGVPAPQLVAAWARLGLVPTEKVPLWAAHWLVAGYDGEHLVYLAGLHGDNPFYVRDALPGALRDCGAEISGSDAAAATGDILRDGYIDNELPVMAVEGGRRVVLKGNRRITALMAISNPSILGKSAARLERLMHRYPDAEIPTQVRVMVFPSRDAAQPLLARLHTSNPKVRWLREQQAVFCHAHLCRAPAAADLLRASRPR